MQQPMTAQDIGLALLLLGVLLLMGKLVRMHWRPAQLLFLPASILAGFIGLVLGPGVLGAGADALLGPENALTDGVFPAAALAVWGDLPGLLINVVFATLLLGLPLPAFSRVWRLAGPQLAFGLSLGAGQYVVGILLAAFVLAPVFGLPLMAGALIEIGFEGGHGTAAGLQPVFAELGFPDGGDLAVGMATVGVVSGIVAGIVLVNWGVRRGHSQTIDAGVHRIPQAQRRGLYHAEETAPDTGHMTVRPESVEPLAFHLAIVAFAIVVGIGIQQALVGIENLTWGGKDGVALFAGVPLFPLAMLGGLAVQRLIQRIGWDHLLDRETLMRIQGAALDLLIAAAIASLSLPVLAEHLGAFLLLAVAGVAWNVALFVWLAPRMIPRYWLERGIGDMGQSMGVTATGLILIKIADPEQRSPAYEAFGYKQLVFEPFFGGGLVTGMALPLIYHFGPWPLFAVMLAILTISLAGGLLYFGRMRNNV